MILSCKYIKEKWDERQKWSHSSRENAAVHTSSSPASSLSHSILFPSVEVHCLHPKMQVWAFTHLLLVKTTSSAPKIDGYSNPDHLKAYRFCPLFSGSVIVFNGMSTDRRHFLSLKTRDRESVACHSLTVFYLSLICSLSSALFENTKTYLACFATGSCAYPIEPDWFGSRELLVLVTGLCAKRFSGGVVLHKCFHWVIQGHI